MRGDEVDAELEDQASHLGAASPEGRAEHALQEGLVEALVEAADALHEDGEHEEFVLGHVGLLQSRERLEELVVLRARAVTDAVERVLYEVANQRLRLFLVEVVVVVVVILRRARSTRRRLLTATAHPLSRHRGQVHRDRPCRAPASAASAAVIPSQKLKCPARFFGFLAAGTHILMVFWTLLARRSRSGAPPRRTNHRSR